MGVGWPEERSAFVQHHRIGVQAPVGCRKPRFPKCHSLAYGPHRVPTATCHMPPGLAFIYSVKHFSFSSILHFNIHFKWILSH